MDVHDDPKNESFAGRLARLGIRLVRGRTRTLQVNTGYLCDLACRHCHLQAGPHRREVMTRQTMDDVVACASRMSFEVIDVTGGAPEMVPGIDAFLARLAPLTRTLILRTNLVAFREPAAAGLMQTCRELGVSLVASFPSTRAGPAESMRGRGVWAKGLSVLQELNRLGYGDAGSPLTLDLAVNPAGAVLPAGQERTERRFKGGLARHGVAFNRLLGFTNVPLGRFRSWLEGSGNLDAYRRLLRERFNPAAVDGLMCRSLISVAWDGALYDCDFNIAAGLPRGNGETHVSALSEYPEEGSAIMTGDHCYACTAGAGFT